MPRRLSAGCRSATPWRSACSTGPAELLPISTLRAHRRSCPWLLGWPYADLDAELRKTFEVALHAGTAAALLIALRDEVRGALTDLDPRRVRIVVLSLLPPAAVTALLERTIERRAGAPGVVAAGLLLGSAAMAAVDGAPQRRRHEEAGDADALWLGVAQSCALVPGRVAQRRHARRRPRARLQPRGRQRLSRHVALPIIAGATALKGWRLARRGLPPRTGVAFAAGAAGGFASTLGVDLAHPPGRARPLAAPLRGLPGRAGRARDPAASTESAAMSDAYARAGVDTRRRRARA